MKKQLKKYLIPHEENDYKPHLLRPRAIAFVCLVVIVAEAAFVFGSRYIVPRSKLYGIIVTNALVDETNQGRIANGLPVLHEDPLLDTAAQQKANDMATNNYFAHTSPAGLTPWYWFQKVGYNFDYAGENLAVNFSDSQDVTNAWMNSPEHRANILDADYTDIGMATAQGTFQGHPAIYVVELFGTEAPTPAVANAPVQGVSTANAAPVPAPVPAPKAQKPKPAVASATPSVVSISIPNIATQTKSSTQQAPGAAVGFVTSDNSAPQERVTNLFQQALSDPKALANEFYTFLMALFAVALFLNIFIKIRIQYPKLIFGAILVIVVAGIAVMLNQSVAAHIAIL